MDTYYELWSALNKIVAEKFLHTGFKQEVQDEIEGRIEKKRREMDDKLKESEQFKSFRMKSLDMKPNKQALNEFMDELFIFALATGMAETPPMPEDYDKVRPSAQGQD